MNQHGSQGDKYRRRRGSSQWSEEISVPVQQELFCLQGQTSESKRLDKSRRNSWIGRSWINITFYYYSKFYYPKPHPPTPHHTPHLTPTIQPPTRNMVMTAQKYVYKDTHNTHTQTQRTHAHTRVWKFKLRDINLNHPQRPPTLHCHIPRSATQQPLALPTPSPPTPPPPHPPTHTHIHPASISLDGHPPTYTPTYSMFILGG